MSATGLFEEIFKAVRDENARRAREGQRLLLISREEANELTEQRELVVEELATDEQIRALAIDLGAWLADIRIKRCRSMLRADSDFVLGRVEGELSKALDFGRRGYSVYVARDVLLGEAQGVMLTTTKLVRDMKGVPLGVYYEIAKLATRPANLRLAVNSDRFARVYGSGRRLVEFAVEECKSRGFSGVYLEASFTAVPFYLRLGFGYGRNVNAEDKRTVGADIMIRPP